MRKTTDVPFVMSPAELDKWFNEKHLPKVKKQYGKKFATEYKRLIDKQDGISLGEILGRHGIIHRNGLLVRGNKRVGAPNFLTLSDKNGLPTSPLYMSVLRNFKIDEPLLRV